MIKYSDDPLSKIKKITPFFYELYNLSVLITYFGFIIISWYFINLAYTINTPNYDILCIGCGIFSHLFMVSVLLIWVFFLYFYIINEIRFRYTHYTLKNSDKNIKRNNIIFIVFSFILTFITLLNIL